MGLLLEQILIYGSVFLVTAIIIFFYLRSVKRKSDKVKGKIKIARQAGLFEPVSLHPVVDINDCIQTGACISACPETDILGIVDGKATTINASQCIGHGACFLACPTEAITLCIGTEKRGVDLPHVSETFETNINGIFIAGELGGMGLIKNAVEQGKQACENIVKSIKNKGINEYDLVIVGAGPAGISAALTAKKKGLKAIVLEQDTLGGTVATFPRQKIVMTSSVDLPLYGKVKLSETSKAELLGIWNDAIEKNNLTILENSKVETIGKVGTGFAVTTSKGSEYVSTTVLLATGRRGTPRKLKVPGELLEKVAYRLLEPENIVNKKIIIFGNGDSGIESALMLCDNNEVTMVYRTEGFPKSKPNNREKALRAMSDGKLTGRSDIIIREIKDNMLVFDSKDGNTVELMNDLVFVFIGGELPTQFLKKIGIDITTKYGDAMLTHKRK